MTEKCPPRTFEELRSVQQGTVALHGRKYSSDLLIPYSGMPITVQCLRSSDEKVWCYDHADRFICAATMTEKRLVSLSIEEFERARFAAQRKRVDDALARLNADIKRLTASDEA